MYEESLRTILRKVIYSMLINFINKGFLISNIIKILKVWYKKKVKVRDASGILVELHTRPPLPKYCLFLVRFSGAKRH